MSLFSSMDRGAPDAEVQAGQVHRHVNFETERQADSVTLCYSFDPLYMFEAIDHQGNAGSLGGCVSYHCNIVLVPDRVANEQVMKALSGEIDSFPRAVAHNAL